MPGEVTVVFRDERFDPNNEDYEVWLRERLEEDEGITVVSVETQEV